MGDRKPFCLIVVTNVVGALATTCSSMRFGQMPSSPIFTGGQLVWLTGIVCLPYGVSILAGFLARRDRKVEFGLLVIAILNAVIGYGSYVTGARSDWELLATHFSCWALHASLLVASVGAIWAIAGGKG